MYASTEPSGMIVTRLEAWFDYDYERGRRPMSETTTYYAAQVGEFMFIEWESYAPDFEVVRGHVEHDDARRTVERELGAGDGAYADAPVEHRYARWTPDRTDSPWDQRIRICDRGRGAFAVTLVYNYGDRRDR